MPGVWQNGLPVPSIDYEVLPYKCNACFSWYATLVLSYVLHHFNIYRLPWIVEHFGEIMSVAIISGFAITLVIDAAARVFHYGGKPLRMSNVWLYDIFMGASLNPRIGVIDLKMFAEVRVPWVLLFLIALSGTVKQYEDLGRVTGNMIIFLTGTGLYINACAKGEHMIPQTWDMFHEKFGFMLIFWNMAGVYVSSTCRDALADSQTIQLLLPRYCNGPKPRLILRIPRHWIHRRSRYFACRLLGL
jgi:delta24(24(1))-sterol reductase